MKDRNPGARRLVLGTNSGTSQGSFDVGLVAFEGEGTARRFELLGYEERPLSAELQARCAALARGEGHAAEVAEADRLHGEELARAVLATLERLAVAPREVRVLGAHGLTVHHHCGREPRATLQVCGAAYLAEGVGIDVVHDFRSRDLATGGEGAPLSPHLDRFLFAGASTPQAVLNLGGIANVSWIGPDGTALGFDTGPANLPLDLLVQAATAGRERMDRDGGRARRGNVRRAWLDAWEARAAQQTRSTGRETYGEPFLDVALPGWRAFEEGAALDDALATLAVFVARAVRRTCDRELPDGAAARATFWTTGGGAHNPALVAALERALAPSPVRSLDAWRPETGLSVDSRETLLFALLADDFLNRRPVDLRGATGAARPAVLGSFTPGRGTA